MSDCFDLGEKRSRTGWVGGFDLLGAMSSLIREPFSSLLRRPGRSRDGGGLRQQQLGVQLCSHPRYVSNPLRRVGGSSPMRCGAPDIITPASTCKGSSLGGCPSLNSTQACQVGAWPSRCFASSPGRTQNAGRALRTQDPFDSSAPEWEYQHHPPASLTRVPSRPIDQDSPLHLLPGTPAH
jgi:hypothetical protein